MPTLKKTYEKFYGGKTFTVSDSAFCRIKKTISDNGFLLNRQNVKTFAKAKKLFFTNIETITFMRYVDEMVSIQPTKKSEIVDFLKSKKVPYQTYHRWLREIPDGYVTKIDLTKLIIKLLKWSKTNVKQYQPIIREIPPQKVRD